MLTRRSLQVGPFWYDIVYNPPIVDKLALPARPMAGFPVLPAATLQFSDAGACQWRWLRRPAAAPAAAAWEDTGCREMMFTPQNGDIGCALRVECRPGRFVAPAGAPPAGAASSHPSGAHSGVLLGEAAIADVGPVSHGPEATAARLRAPAAAKPPAPLPGAPPAFRIMTYNILADQYAASDYAKTVLFNYCPLDRLEGDYRKQLVLEELLTYDADVICLQARRQCCTSVHSWHTVHLLECFFIDYGSC